MRDRGDRILISSSCIVLSTKKYSHTLKVELFYLVWMFRTSNPGDSISVALRKLLQGGRGWVRLCTGLQHRELAVCTSKIRYQVKGSSILYLGGAASGHCLHSFPVTSAIGASPISSPTLLPAPPASQQSRGWGSSSTPWITIWGALIHIWGPEITDGGDISCSLIWQEIFSFNNFKDSHRLESVAQSLSLAVQWLYGLLSDV